MMASPPRQPGLTSPEGPVRKENINPGDSYVPDMQVRELFLQKTGECQSILEEHARNDERLSLEQRDEMEKSMGSLLNQGFYIMTRKALSPQEYYQGCMTILFARLIEQSNPNSVIAALRTCLCFDSTSDGDNNKNRKTSLLSLIVDNSQRHPGLALQDFEHILGFASTIQSTIAAVNNRRQHHRKKLLRNAIKHKQPSQKQHDLSSHYSKLESDLGQGSLEALWVIPMSYLVGYVVYDRYRQQEAQEGVTLAATWKSYIQPKIDAILYAAFPRLSPNDYVDAGLTLLQLDLLLDEDENSILKLVNTKSVAEELAQQNILKPLATVTGLPQYTFLARCAEIFLGRLDTESVDDIVNACSQLLQKESPSEYLRYLENNSDIALCKDNNNRLLLKSDAKGPAKKLLESDATAAANDIVSYRDRLLSPGYPVLMHIDAILVKGIVEQAIDIAVNMEKCHSLSEEDQLEGWSKIFRYLSQTGQVFLDGFPLNREEYLMNRKLILEKIVTRAGPLAMDVFVDGYVAILEQVAQLPRIGEEERVYIHRACHQTVLRILQAKYNEEQGMEMFHQLYWKSLDASVAESAGRWSSLSLSSSKEEQMRWACHLLTTENEVPESLKFPGTCRPDLDLLIRRIQTKRQQLEPTSTFAEYDKSEEKCERKNTTEPQKGTAASPVEGDVDVEVEEFQKAEEFQEEEIGEDDEDSVVSNHDQYAEKPEGEEKLEGGDNETEEEEEIHSSEQGSDANEQNNEVVLLDDSDDDEEENVADIIPRRRAGSDSGDESDETADEESVTEIFQDTKEDDSEDDELDQEDYVDEGYDDHDESEQEPDHVQDEEPHAEVVDMTEDDDEEEEDGVVVDKEESDGGSHRSEEAAPMQEDMVEATASQSMDEVGSQTGYEPDTHGFTEEQSEEEVSEAVHTEDEEDERREALMKMKPDTSEIAPEPVQPKPLESREALHFSDMADDEHTTEHEDDLGAESSELDEGHGTEAPVPPPSGTFRAAAKGATLTDFAKRAQEETPQEHSPAPTPTGDVSAPWHWGQKQEPEGETPVRQQEMEPSAQSNAGDTNAAHLGASSVSFLEDGSIGASEGDYEAAAESPSKVVVDQVPKDLQDAQSSKNATSEASGLRETSAAALSIGNTSAAHLGASSVSFLGDLSFEPSMEDNELESPTKVVIDHVPIELQTDQRSEPHSATEDEPEELSTSQGETPQKLQASKPLESEEAQEQFLSGVGASIADTRAAHAPTEDEKEEEADQEIVVDVVPEKFDESSPMKGLVTSAEAKDADITPIASSKTAATRPLQDGEDEAEHHQELLMRHSEDEGAKQELNKEETKEVQKRDESPEVMEVGAKEQPMEDTLPGAEETEGDEVQHGMLSDADEEPLDAKEESQQEDKDDMQQETPPDTEELADKETLPTKEADAVSCKTGGEDEQVHDDHSTDALKEMDDSMREDGIVQNVEDVESEEKAVADEVDVEVDQKLPANDDKIEGDQQPSANDDESTSGEKGRDGTETAEKQKEPDTNDVDKAGDGETFEDSKKEEGSVQSEKEGNAEKLEGDDDDNEMVARSNIGADKDTGREYTKDEEMGDEAEKSSETGEGDEVAEEVVDEVERTSENGEQIEKSTETGNDDEPAGQQQHTPEKVDNQDTPQQPQESTTEDAEEGQEKDKDSETSLQEDATLSELGGQARSAGSNMASTPSRQARKDTFAVSSINIHAASPGVSSVATSALGLGSPFATRAPMATTSNAQGETNSDDEDNDEQEKRKPSRQSKRRKAEPNDAEDEPSSSAAGTKKPARKRTKQSEAENSTTASNGGASTDRAAEHDAEDDSVAISKTSRRSTRQRRTDTAIAPPSSPATRTRARRSRSDSVSDLEMGHANSDEESESEEEKKSAPVKPPAKQRQPRSTKARKGGQGASDGEKGEETGTTSPPRRPTRTTRKKADKNDEESAVASRASRSTKRSATAGTQDKNEDMPKGARRSTRASAKNAEPTSKAEDEAGEEHTIGSQSTTRRSTRQTKTRTSSVPEASKTPRRTTRRATTEKTSEAEDEYEDDQDVAESPVATTTRSTRQRKARASTSTSKKAQKKEPASEAEDGDESVASSRAKGRPTRGRARADSDADDAASVTSTGRKTKSQKRSESVSEAESNDAVSADGTASTQSKGTGGRKKRKTTKASEPINLAPIPEEETLTSPAGGKGTGTKRTTRKAKKAAATEGSGDEEEEDEPKTQRKTAKRAVRSTDDDKSVAELSTASSVRRSSRSTKGQRKKRAY